MYRTRRKSGAGLRRSSRVDRRKTRVGLLAYLKDSDDSASDPADSASDTKDSASDDGERSGSDDTEDRQNEKQPARSGNDDEEEEEEACAPPRAGRKRSSSAVFADSSSSSDSDEVGRPVRSVLPKKRPCLSDSEAEAEGHGARPEREKEKRRERRAKLLELSRRRRARTGRSARGAAEGSGKESEDDDDDEEDATCTLQHSSEEGTESDSLKDFIVDDEEQKHGDEDEGESQERSLLSYHLPQMVLGSQLKHFELVVKALLINALDQTFLQSLYDGDRTKRYAREMKDSLHHLDQRTVIPRLVNLKQRSRWSERYKERVECYPNVKIMNIGRYDRQCEACQLHRHIRFCVRLSGQLYDDKTLQEDTFMPNDTQVFRVGAVCANRTEVYHQLKHFKYHLFRRCQEELKKEEEAPVKDMVSEAFSRLHASGWIRKQYEDFEDHLNRADYFQEEKLD